MGLSQNKRDRVAPKPGVYLYPDGVWWGLSEAGKSRWGGRDSTQRKVAETSKPGAPY